MSGVWVFDNGVIRLVRKAAEGGGGGGRRKEVLMYIPTNEAMTSHRVLKNKLLSLGWEVYYEDSEMVQFHKPCSLDLISLPTDFNKIKPRHLYDVVLKNRNIFQVNNIMHSH